MLELPAQEQLICRRWIEAAHRSKEWDRKFAKADKCADDAMKSKSTRRALTKEAQTARSFIDHALNMISLFRIERDLELALGGKAAKAGAERLGV